MNARSQTFELTVEGRQIEEVVLSLFHTLLFHRTTGKFQYKQEGTYSIGTVGMVELDCDYTDFSYIRCDSADLDAYLRKEVSGFRDLLKSNDGLHSGQISLEFYQKKKNRWPFPDESIPWEISLEFYQKKKNRWPFPDESIPWEVWTLKINVVTLTNEHERQAYREKLGELLGEKVVCIVEAMNRHDYLPKAPNQPLLDTVFNTSFSDVQPYLFKISCQNSGPTNASVGTAVRKLVRDTLAL